MLVRANKTIIISKMKNNLNCWLSSKFIKKTISYYKVELKVNHADHEENLMKIKVKLKLSIAEPELW